MKTSLLARPLAILFSVAALSTTAIAKDEPISLEACPAPVQVVIKHYSAQGALEGIGVDKKAKSSGDAVYEAKFALPSGKRVEVHISADGKVMQVEEKKAKN